jgi:hypothetical protein
MSAQDDAFDRANAEANETFERLRQTVEEVAQGGASQVDVLDVARRAGLEISEETLRELQIPQRIPVQPFLEWHIWFPFRPIWCWWWRFRYPWYRCCPYWWYRCHWW